MRWRASGWRRSLLRNALLEDIPKSVGLKPAIGDIRINPFLLQLEVKDFSLSGYRAARSCWASSASSSSSSCPPFGIAPIPSATSISTSPFVERDHRQRRPPESAAAQPKIGAAASPNPDQKSAAPLPSLRIRFVQVSRGFVSFDDRSRPSRFRGAIAADQFRTARTSPPESMAAALPSAAHRSSASGSSGVGMFRCSRSSPMANSIRRAAGAHHLGVPGRSAEFPGQFGQDRFERDLQVFAARRRRSESGCIEGCAHAISPSGRRTRTSIGLRCRNCCSTAPRVDLSKRQAHVDSLTVTGLKVAGVAGAGWVVQPAEAGGDAGCCGARNIRLAAARPPAASAPAAAAGPQWRFDLRELCSARCQHFRRGSQHPAGGESGSGAALAQGRGCQLGSGQACDGGARYQDQRHRHLERERRDNPATRERRSRDKASGHRFGGGSTLHCAIHLDDAACGSFERQSASCATDRKNPLCSWAAISASRICIPSTTRCTRASSIGIAWTFRG